MRISTFWRFLALEEWRLKDVHNSHTSLLAFPYGTQLDFPARRLPRGDRQSLLNMLGAVWYVVLVIEEVMHQLGKRL